MALFELKRKDRIMAHYIVESKVKKYVHDNDRRISRAGIHAIDVKVGKFLEKCISQFNGHSKTIDETIVNLLTLGGRQ